MKTFWSTLHPWTGKEKVFNNTSIKKRTVQLLIKNPTSSWVCSYILRDAVVHVQVQPKLIKWTIRRWLILPRMERPLLPTAETHHLLFTALLYLIWDQQEENSPLQSRHVNKELLYPLKLRCCLFTFSEVKGQLVLTERSRGKPLVWNCLLTGFQTQMPQREILSSAHTWQQLRARCQSTSVESQWPESRGRHELTSKALKLYMCDFKRKKKKRHLIQWSRNLFIA